METVLVVLALATALADLATALLQAIPEVLRLTKKRSKKAVRKRKKR